jgi:ABC-type phosphate transport system substrate-binding protein
MRAARYVPLLLALVVMSPGHASTATTGDFKVIANPEVSGDAVDRDFLRDAYLKKSNEWGNGEAIHPIDLASKFRERDRFTEQVIRKTPAQLRTYWNQQIFSGKGVPPPEADAVDDVIDYVVSTKGAIGYVPLDVDAGKAKVLKLR